MTTSTLPRTVQSTASASPLGVVTHEPVATARVANPLAEFVYVDHAVDIAGKRKHCVRYCVDGSDAKYTCYSADSALTAAARIQAQGCTLYSVPRINRLWADECELACAKGANKQHHKRAANPAALGGEAAKMRAEYAPGTIARVEDASIHVTRKEWDTLVATVAKHDAAVAEHGEQIKAALLSIEAVGTLLRSMTK